MELEFISPKLQGLGVGQGQFRKGKPGCFYQRKEKCILNR